MIVRCRGTAKASPGLTQGLIFLGALLVVILAVLFWVVAIRKKRESAKNISTDLAPVHPLSRRPPLAFPKSGKCSTNASVVAGRGHRAINPTLASNRRLPPVRPDDIAAVARDADAILKAAMQQCRAITRKSASNLALAFVLLPKARRDAMAGFTPFAVKWTTWPTTNPFPVTCHRQAQRTSVRARRRRRCAAAMRFQVTGTDSSSATSSTSRQKA